MENEMNCLTRRGVLIKNPMWWIEEIKINGEVVDNPELPLGDVGNIKPDALEYSIYRIFWLTLSKLTKFMQENKIEWKIKLYDRGCLSVTWDNKEGKYKVDREKL